jgi:hypothetical protein
MHQQFNIQQLYVLPTHCIYVFSVYLRTSSDSCHLYNKLIGFYNRDEKCLLRGTNWVFKESGLRFVFKGSILNRIRFLSGSHTIRPVETGSVVPLSGSVVFLSQDKMSSFIVTRVPGRDERAVFIAPFQRAILQSAQACVMDRYDKHVRRMRLLCDDTGADVRFRL